MIKKTELGLTGGMKHNTRAFIGLMFVLNLCTTFNAHAENWTLSSKSKVGFDIKSMGISIVKGTFDQVQSKMNFNIQHPSQASVNLVMKVDSLDINKSSLKEEIMGPDLFYAAKFKTVTFKSTQFKSLGAEKYNIQGNLTIRGITKPVIFKTTLRPDISNAKKLNIYASTMIKRSDFGMEPATAGVGERVNLQISGQWITQ
jgi:polyisoprenoid-binding protein YceI